MSSWYMPISVRMKGESYVSWYEYKYFQVFKLRDDIANYLHMFMDKVNDMKWTYVTLIPYGIWLDGETCDSLYWYFV